jgi:aspartate kinase
MKLAQTSLHDPSFEKREGTLCVLKFGGAAVATPARFTEVANLIYKRAQRETSLVIVVSAMGDTTDELIELAHQVHPHPPKRELDMLISVGERISISLLAMALDRVGIAAVSFTGSQSGILTSHDHSDAKILDVKPHRILKALNNKKVAIVAGFQGMCASSGDITTLGRGGSDTTAVALAAALGADRVEFYKDVEGIYDSDPKFNPSAKKFDQLTYSEALAITRAGAQVLHPRCIEIAARNKIPLWVLPYFDIETRLSTYEFDDLLNSSIGTCIGWNESKFNQPKADNASPVFENEPLSK